MLSTRALLAVAAFLCAAALAAPFASAAAPSDEPVETRCQGDLHTVQLICFHETPKEYLNCYLVVNGPLRWTECL